MTKKQKYKKSVRPVQPRPVRRKSALALEMVHFADRINRRNNADSAGSLAGDAYVLPKRSMKLTKSLIAGKRGTRIFDRAKCALCGIWSSNMWRYKIEEGVHLYICNTCKNKVKPSNSVSSILYNGVETNRRRH